MTFARSPFAHSKRITEGCSSVPYGMISAARCHI